MILTYEVSPLGQSTWTKLGDTGPGGRYGSVVERYEGRRAVILFRCCTSGASVINRSLGGTDYEPHTGIRVVTPLFGMETLAVLTEDGQTYERVILTERGVVHRARWTHHS